MNRDQRILCVIVLLALVLRAVAAWTWNANLNADVDGYRGIAQMLVAGNGYADATTKQPTAFRPPLFPLCLAGLLALGGGNTAIAGLQIAVGTATVLLTALTCIRLNLRVWWLPPLLVAVDPLSLAYTPRVMTEVLAGFTLAVILWVASRWWHVPGARSNRWIPGVLGLCFGAAALCRPTVWAMLPFTLLLVTYGLRANRLAWPETARAGLVIAFGAALVVAPWTVRNLLVLGKPVFATTHGGYTLLLGNNPEFYDKVARGPWGEVWDSQPWQDSIRRQVQADGVAPTDEIARDRWMYARAAANIRTDPGGFARACWLRVRRFWHVVPLVETQSRLVTWAVGGFYVLLLGGVAASLVRNLSRTSPVILLAWCQVLAFASVHVLYWSNARMRAPLVVALAILSARGWAAPSADSSSVPKPD